MSAHAHTWLWIAQRASAAVLAVAVLVHLATMIAVVRGGLSAAEITDRLGGHVGWLGFYAAFVLAAAIHAGIGVRNVLLETIGVGVRVANWASPVFAGILLWLGMVAVVAMYRA